MTIRGKVSILSILGLGLFIQQAPGQTATPATSSKTTAAPTTAPSPQDISDAKAKGMVWVNLKTRVYHKDGAFYGTTKHGKFMSEDDATKAGYRAAKEPAGKKAATPAQK